MIKLITTIIITFAITSTGVAGSQSKGSIAQIIPVTHSFGFLMANGSRDSAPACAAANPNNWSVDVSTPQGQAIAASVITAFAMGKQIFVQGTGICPTYQTSIEQVFFVAVYP